MRTSLTNHQTTQYSEGSKMVSALTSVDMGMLAGQAMLAMTGIVAGTVILFKMVF